MSRLYSPDNMNTPHMVLCPVCGKGFESAKRYASHVRHKHPQVKILCMSCGTCFPAIKEAEEGMDTSEYDWAMDVLTRRVEEVQLTMDLEPGEVPTLIREDLNGEELAATSTLRR